MTKPSEEAMRVWRKAFSACMNAHVLNEDVLAARVIDTALAKRPNYGDGYDAGHAIGLVEGAKLRTADIVAWLRDGNDQAAEDLCTAHWAENKRQGERNIHAGQPYFDLFANAIEERFGNGNA
jgi:hypothetical protein